MLQQKKELSGTIVTTLRQELLNELLALLNETLDEMCLSKELVVHARSFVFINSAFKCIAGIKYVFHFLSSLNGLHLKR